MTQVPSSFPADAKRAAAVVIVGAGSIGLSFAAAFADAGRDVVVIERDAARRSAVVQGLEVQHQAMALAEVARGAQGRVEVVEHFAQAPLDQCDLVIECGPENLEIKQALFSELLAATAQTTPVVTASSAIPMSRVLPNPEDQARSLVVHPVNPPAVLRVLELSPAPATRPEIVAVTQAIFAAVGFHCVRLQREVEGLLLNRLQGAVLREAYRLVEDGICEAQDIEAVMTLGLGPRWALSGPFETVELNTPGGIRAHAARMGPAYARMGAERGERVDWHEALVAKVEAQRRAAVPAEALAPRAAWRARAVAQVVKARNALLLERP